VLCGFETGLWSALEQGAAGAVLSLANASPYSAIALWEAHRTREEEAGLDWQSRMAPAAELVSRCGVAGLKYAMDLNGYYGGPPRLPFLPLTADLKAEVEQLMSDLRN
jgi:4-hydroxy-2-oxoglutarate aldolase